MRTKHDNIYLKAGKHLDDKYFDENGARYATTAAVLARIPKGERVLDGTHNVSGVEYWFHADLDTLDIKTIEVDETNLVHITGNGTDPEATEIITTPKEFTAANTQFNGVESNVATGVGVLGTSSGVEGYGLVGMASYVPIQGTTTDITPNTVKLCEVINGTPDTLNPVQVGYGLERRVDTPWLGDLLCKPMFRDDFILTDVTVNLESGKREYWCRQGGEWFLQGSWDENGNLIVNGDITASNIKQTVFDIILPNSATVQGRCDTPTELPSGWTIAAEVGFPLNLQINHGLARRIASVTVWSIDANGETQLLNNAAYSVVNASTSSILKVRSLATIATPIRITLIFS